MGIFMRDMNGRNLPLANILMGAILTSVLVGSSDAATNWIAFNDHVPGPAPGANGWGTAPNVTVYNMRGVAGTPPEPTTGSLTNFLTGERLTATLVVTANGAPDFFGGISYPDVGTPAYNLFNGKVDLG